LIPQESSEGCKFGSAEDIKPAAVQWPKISRLALQWDACINVPMGIIFTSLYSFPELILFK
jgi:hypothetical protein